MVLEAIQKPHPPMWMGVHSQQNVEFAAQQGINIISLHAAPSIRDKFDHYKSVWRELHGPDAPVGKTGLGLFVVVGETDEAAQEIAARNYYRPRLESVATKYAAQFPRIKLFTLAEVFGDWGRVQKLWFDDGGIFDQIYQN
jgi:alkanesulfonate monooxygenase SsuD/methylene tetrahydromethanopterin reductase-like flavin-dependent oxidoreductase (luciferase family)